MINFLLTYFKLIDNPKDGYVDYYHYVVGRTPKEKTNTFSDRLIVSAFEDISNQESSGIWVCFFFSFHEKITLCFAF